MMKDTADSVSLVNYFCQYIGNVYTTLPTIIYYVYNPEISGTMYSRHHMKVCSLKYCFAIEENRKQSVCSIRKRVDN